MRTNEERIRLMHQKALLLEQENREKKIRWLQYGSVGLAFAMTILLALIMPRFAQLSIEGAVPDNMIASIFALNKSLSFIIIAILSFILGISVTVFCYCLKKSTEERHIDVSD